METIRELEVIVNGVKLKITIKIKGDINDKEIDKMVSNILSTKDWKLI